MMVPQLSLILDSLVLLSLTSASPTRGYSGLTFQHSFDASSGDLLQDKLISDDLKHDQGHEAMIALLDKYAPVLKLSIAEAYFPSSVEYMLPHFTYATVNGSKHYLNPNNLTLSNLDSLPRRGQDYFLSIPEPHNPQPFIEPSAEYLLGPAGQDGGMEDGGDGRGRVKEDIYGFWVDQGRGVVDLWYWTYYPYNFGKFAGPFGVIGNHVGDWEHIRMRTINGTAESVDYHAHSGGPTVSGTLRWKDVEKEDGRPVGYIAAGSHGIWPTPGNHELAPLLNYIKLVDICDDAGPIWDTKGSVIPFQYWNSHENRTKVNHEGKGHWMNFRGRYGNTGENNCWWYKLVGNCQLVDAPPGPNRWFGSPPICTIAPAVSGNSRYAFYLSERTARWAKRRHVANIQLEQVCRRPRRKEDEMEDEHSGAGSSRSSALERGGDDSDDVEVWTTTGTCKFRGQDRHEITTMACKGMQAAVKSYRLSFCLADGRCIFSTVQRDICAYVEDKEGYISSRAVDLEDLDEWFDMGK
ncbi:hypothetical protein BD324DRAFT_621352 [Kockovaella imperatae]|uniref:Vacuolar protein sorting-associated protein 62 n=1 Tax=Kockovaella imperatae TaxID=4999 RepID=A0A1Y1UM49_9TREE|nr:hypothetical protein BD324DRAFT_621352 [Kockovaella imperatae]ORX38556.1 hypothetical protein BD324DRAFT_621352 [Kockovaella imperatae]